MPPSWAYPYATVWEDFETAGVLATSPSGGTWTQDTAGDLYGGLTGGGRTGVGGVGPDLTVNRSAEPGIPIPGAGSEGVYVKFEAYAVDAQSGFDLLVTDANPPRVPGHLFDFFWNATLGGTFYQDNTPGGTDFDEYDLPTVPNWLDSAWHTFECRLLTDTVTILVDGVTLGSSALLNPGVGPVYVGPSLSYSTTFGGMVYLDNLEAGPLGAAPAPGTKEVTSPLQLADTTTRFLTFGAPVLAVPQLGVGQGPQHVRFESPR